jgi:ABC-type multidrug transport system ATPase subunit
VIVIFRQLSKTVISQPTMNPTPIPYSYGSYTFSPAAAPIMFTFTGLVFLLPLIFYGIIMTRYCCDKSLREELRLPSIRKQTTGLFSSSRPNTTSTKNDNAPTNNSNPNNNNNSTNNNLNQPPTNPAETNPTTTTTTPKPYEMLLTFRSVTYIVDDKIDIGKQKILLQDVNGYFEPGTLTALVGPSGCGKTTLLSALADTQNGGILTGDIRVNGKIRGQSFRKNAAFVVQNDRLFPSLTIRETLWFAVELRTRVEIKSALKREIVHEVLEDLDLMKWADVACSQLSGGQKRRVTVALELVARPTFIFLDEPTSGLDGSGALALVRVLRKLADKRKTIVCTIHQPRIDAFLLFHRVLMLNAGKLVYFGSVQDITNHFQEQHVLEQQNNNDNATPTVSADELNPADFLLDLTHSPATSAGLDEQFVKSPLYRDLISFIETSNTNINTSNTTISNNIMNENSKPFYDESKGAIEGHGEKMDGKYVTTQLKQIITLLRRALINDVRSSSYLMQWVLGIIMMLFMGMLYCYVKNPNLEGLADLNTQLSEWGACTQNLTSLIKITNSSSPSQVTNLLQTCGDGSANTLELVQARMSLLYQLLAGAFFSEMPQVAAIYDDRGSYFREHASRCYSTSSWIWFWIIKLTFSGFVKGIIFPPFVYFSAQMTLDPVGYFFFSMNMALMSIAGGAISLFAVIVTETFETATVCFVVVSLLTQNLCGYWIPLFKIGWWFRWICFINFFFFTYQSVVVSQYLNSYTQTSFQGSYTTDLNIVFVALIVSMAIIFSIFLLTWLLAWVQGHKPSSSVAAAAAAAATTTLGGDEDDSLQGSKRDDENIVLFCWDKKKYRFRCERICRGQQGRGGLSKDQWVKEQHQLSKAQSIQGNLAFQAKAAAAGTPALTFGL